MLNKIDDDDDDDEGMKLFYVRFFSQTRRLFLCLGALVGINADFEDQSNQTKCTITFIVRKELQILPSNLMLESY
jgi:hypothetical protein